MNTKTGRPIVFFDGDVTPSEIMDVIPEDFDGDIVVTGSIHSKSENPETFENLIISLNGGNLYVYKDIFICPMLLLLMVISTALVQFGQHLFLLILELMATSLCQVILYQLLLQQSLAISLLNQQLRSISVVLFQF